MYKACIFDLDGTLLNTLPTIAYNSNRSLKTFGFHQISEDVFQSMCGLSFKDYYESLLRHGGCPEEEIEELRDQIGNYDKKIYMEDPLYLTEPFPGILEILAALKQKGVKLAVLTNKPDQIAQNIVSAVFPNMFDACVGYTGLNHSKPDPRSLWELINRLSLEKQDCIYVGDTNIDILAANNAEVFSIAVDWGYQSADMLAESSPGALISSPQDLLQYFD